MSKLEEKYGELKIMMESEGDGYFFWGYGLPGAFSEEKDIKEKFETAAKAIDEFKTLVEKKITENGGNPEDWTY